MIQDLVIVDKLIAANFFTLSDMLMDEFFGGVEITVTHFSNMTNQGINRIEIKARMFIEKRNGFAQDQIGRAHV